MPQIVQQNLDCLMKLSSWCRVASWCTLVQALGFIASLSFALFLKQATDEEPRTPTRRPSLLLGVKKVTSKKGARHHGLVFGRTNQSL